METKYLLFAFCLLLLFIYAPLVSAVYVCSTDNSQFLDLNACQTSCLLGGCTEANPTGCPGSQTNPYSVCENGNCVSKQGCGISNCINCINTGTPNTGTPNAGTPNVSNPSGGGSSVQITNPLKWNTFEELINAIIDFLWLFALAVVPAVIIIAGYFFVTSAGDPAKVSQAKKMVLYALIGLLVIGMAKGIVALIQQVFK